MLAGVCGGIAEYFDIDSSLVRIGLALMIVFGGTGILAYIIAWIIVPEYPLGYQAYKERRSADPEYGTKRDARVVDVEETSEMEAENQNQSNDTDSEDTTGGK
jgi:phage shock protein PspC (stress-responsive transcriptional regulator)